MTNKKHDQISLLPQSELDEAYEILEQAQNAKSKKKALELAKKAYETCNACMDAGIMIAELQDKVIDKEKQLVEVLAQERKRLEQEGYFNQDNIGHFYEIYETRSYIVGMYILLQIYFHCAKMKLAQEVSEEILRLNINDNMGVRDTLMAVYTCLEDENNLFKLYEKYNENSLHALVCLFVFYFKKSDYEKTLEYLKIINKENKYFVKLIKDENTNYQNIMTSYIEGAESEAMVVLEKYSPLLLNMPSLFEFVCTAKLK